MLDCASRSAGTGLYQPSDGEFLPSPLRLPAVPRAAPLARRHVLRALRAWGLDTLCETAELLVSELVTNAMKASGLIDGKPPSLRARGQPPTISVSLARTETGVVMAVWDASPAPPAVSQPSLTGEGGRGLFLVDVLCRNWGYHPADGGGKVVWCDLDVP